MASKRKSDDDLASSLQDNFLMKAVGKVANPETYRIGGKPKTKPGQASNLPASYFSTSNKYGKAVNGVWQENSDKPATKKPSAKKSPLGGHRGS